jgi:hypothetical protein
MKRTIAILSAALMLMCMTAARAADPGSSEDPLATLEYLNGTYRQRLTSDWRAEVDKTLGAVFDGAVQKFALDTPGGGTYSFADSFTELALQPGDSIRLITGSRFILIAGSASVTIAKGGVVNVSTGNAVSSGSMLVKNQRYMCVDEDAEAVITASSSVNGQVDGYYSTNGVTVSKHAVFADIKTSDWFYGAVDYAYSNKLFTGTSADTFSPGDSMTRGMFVTVLYRLDGTPPVADAGEFPDAADPSQYYYGAVGWANGNSIVTGYEDGRFQASANISREQMAVIMYRYATYKNIDVAVESSPAYDAFPDKASVSPYASDAVRWASAKGIINGSNGELLPGETATRAQVAQIILNFSQNMAEG